MTRAAPPAVRPIAITEEGQETARALPHCSRRPGVAWSTSLLGHLAPATSTPGMSVRGGQQLVHAVVPAAGRRSRACSQISAPAAAWPWAWVGRGSRMTPCGRAPRRRVSPRTANSTGGHGSAQGQGAPPLQQGFDELQSSITFGRPPPVFLGGRVSYTTLGRGCLELTFACLLVQYDKHPAIQRSRSGFGPEGVREWQFLKSK